MKKNMNVITTKNSEASLCTAKPLFDNDFDHIFKLICMWIQQ